MNAFINHLFAGSIASYKDAVYVIFGVPFDSTTSFRTGTRDGPREIRELSYNFESYVPAHNVDLNDVPFIDLGNLDTNAVPNDVMIEVQAVVQDVIKDGKIPVMIGGEHSITIGAVRAVKPDMLIVCDAHLDLREEYRGSIYNHACITRRIYDDGIHDIIHVGSRSGTADQFVFAQNHLTVFSSAEIQKKGMNPVIQNIQNRIEGKRVYLSIDADVIDSCLTPGLGTPEPFGLSPENIRDLISAVAPHSLAFDYVEVCPAYDHGQAATVGASMIREYIASHWKANKNNKYLAL
ncbi:MAG: agmatinase [Methanoregula sp. PtaU1.Bin051]|nr:MAG: agmatinase [Methanoregula sp. PtaU1.Bin051]